MLKLSEDELEDANKKHKLLLESIHNLFIRKNEQYGNMFMKNGRIYLFIDMMRKWIRLSSCFAETEDKIEFNKDKIKSLIPTLVDIVNYASMMILRELEVVEGEEEGGWEMLRRIRDEIEAGNDIIDIKRIIKEEYDTFCKCNC